MILLRRHLFRPFRRASVVALIIFALTTVFVFRNFILQDGIVLYRDIFPVLYFDKVIERFYSTWYSGGSTPQFEILIYIPYITPFLSLVYVGYEYFQRTLYLLSFFFGLFNMYLFTYYFILKKERYDKNVKMMAAIASSLIYMLNPFAVGLLIDLGMLVGYAFLPLVFGIYIRGIEKSRKTIQLKYSVLLALVMVVTTISPHSIIYIWFLIFGWFLFNTLLEIKDIRLKKGLANVVLNWLIFTLTTFLIYIAFSAFWLAPYLNASSIREVLPPYVLSYELISILGKTTLLETLALRSSFWPPIVFDAPKGLEHIYAISSSVIVILAFLSFLFGKSKKVLFFGVLALASILFVYSVNFHNWIIFHSPASSSLGWVFRVPSRFNVFLAFAYSSLAAFTLAKILGSAKIKIKAVSRTRLVRLISVTVMLGLFLFNSWPALTGDFKGSFYPYAVPKSFYSINNYLLYQPRDAYSKVVWMPDPEGRELSWNPKVSGDIYTFSSRKPSIAPMTAYSSLYFNYLQSKLSRNETLNLGKYLVPLNIRYIVFHDDVIGSDKNILRALECQQDLSMVRQEDFFYAFKNNHDISEVFIPLRNLAVVGGLGAVSSLNSVLSFQLYKSSLIFFDQQTNISCVPFDDVESIVLDYGRLKTLGILPIHNQHVIAPFTYSNHHNPAGLWSKGRATDPLHGPWHLYLEQREIESWDFDYGVGLVFTWAPLALEEPFSLKDEDLISKFGFEDKNLGNWTINAQNIQSLFSSEDAYEGAYSLKVELYDSTWSWKTINSPLIQAKYGGSYKWEFYVKGENAHGVHAKIVEYDKNKKYVAGRYVAGIGTGNFGWKKNSFNFAPTYTETAYMQLQIWHGHETKQPLPNKVWIDNVKVYDLKNYLKPNTLEMPFTTQTTGAYDLYIRYFRNQDGGKIALYLDGKPIETINTKNQINGFMWKNIGTYNLNRGKHTLTLENREGFNAVNLFALIPQEEVAELEERVESLLQNKRIIYILEAESDMYRENSPTSNKYGGEASNGEVVELTLLSWVWNELEVVKSGNYTIVIRGKGNLNIKIDEKEYATNSSQFDWTYLGPISLEKGKHKIEITSSLTYYSQWNFENGELQEWQGNTPEIQTLSLDEKPYEGSYSLKAELYASTWGWKVIQSPIIPVTPGSIYKWDFYVAGENAHGVHAKIVEYDKNKKYVAGRYMAGVGTGNFTWKNINFEYTPSQNASYINLQIWHGHETKQLLPNKVWTDNIKVYGYKPSDPDVVCKPSDLDVVWLYSTQKENETLEDIFTPNENPAEVISYQKIDPTKYIVEVNATKPFTLSFAEAYDPLWIAHVNGERIESIPLYSVINGFWINKTGQLEITIEYEPQKWFYYGSAISITTLITCTTYLAYIYTKNKNITNKIKQKLKTLNPKQQNP